MNKKILKLIVSSCLTTVVVASALRLSTYASPTKAVPNTNLLSSNLPLFPIYPLDPNRPPDNGTSKNRTDAGRGSVSYKETNIQDKSPNPPVPVTSETAKTVNTGFKAAVDKAVEEKANVEPVNVKSVAGTDIKYMADGEYVPSLVLKTATNNVVLSKVVIAPASIKAETISTDVKFDTAAVKNLFNKYYKNNLQVVDFTQEKALGATASVTVKLNKDVADKNVTVYRYDAEQNKYYVIENSSVDGNNYVTFKADPYGTIIISEGSLKK